MGQSILTVDLGALAENWRCLADRARGAECAAVVKADAYGLGIAPVARALLDEGCKTFFVAHLREGEILRRARSAPRGAHLHPQRPRAVRRADFTRASQLIPVLGSLPEIAEWADFCAADGVPHPAAIHIDTGMNRLGLAAHDLPRAASSRTTSRRCWR